jgi:hypothetical protein
MNSGMSIKFEREGRTYEGELRRVSGAGKMYHLMVKNYYQG